MFRCKNCGGEFGDEMRAGTNLWCRPCRAAYVKDWRAKNPGYTKAKNDAYRSAHADECRAYNAEYRAKPENREKARQRVREWYRTNKDRAVAWERENRSRRQERANGRHKERMLSDPVYAEKHRIWTRTARAKRRAAEAAGLAKHHADEIKRIYAECPKGHEVDHIYPLLGENFSGLHVPWNLQYLPVKENRSKGNRI